MIKRLFGTSFSPRSPHSRGAFAGGSRRRSGLCCGLLLGLAAATIHANPVHSYVDPAGVLVYFTVNEAHTDIDGEPTLVPEAPPAPPGPVTRSSRFDPLIEKYAAVHSVDPNLVREVIAAESNFNPSVVSRKGAVGLMQLIPATGQRFGVASLFNPEQNIEGGVKYLRFLLDAFKNDVKLVLAAYNAGENVVKRYRGVPPYPETQNYVRLITSRYGDTYQTAVAEPPPVEAASLNPGYRVYRVVDPASNVVLYTNRP